MIRRVFAGLSLSAANLAVTTAGQLLTVPIYLLHWGTQVYGEWLILTSLASSAALLHFGVQTYAGNLLIGAFVKGDLEAGNRLLHSALRLYVLFCGLALAALGGLIVWPGLTARLNIATMTGVQARAIVLVYGLIYIYGILGGLLMSLFRATNQLPRQLAYALVENIIFLFGPASVALAGGRPAHSALITGLLFAGISLVEFRDIRRRSPFTLGWSGGSWQAALALLGPSVTFFLVSLAAQLLSTGVTLTISATIGAAAVAIYATTLMLTNFVRTIVNQGLNVLWPEITAAAAQTEPGRLMRWHRLALKLAGVFLLAAAVGVGLLGPAVLNLWTGGEIQIDRMLNWLFVGYLLAHGPALVSGVFGLAMNRQAQLLRANVVTAVLTVGLAVGLLPRIGLGGAALALALGQAVGSIWILGLACDWTGDTWLGLGRAVALRGLPAAAVALIGAGLLDVWMAGLAGRAFGAVALALVVTGFGWWTWCSVAERALIAEQAHGLLARLAGGVRPREVSA